MRQLNAEDNSITDLPFEFEVSDDHKGNQERYEALGEVINEHVYQMLLDIGLHKIDVPSPQKTEGTSSFVFGTKESFKDSQKLLILIHGSGVVRAGQWSRSLIINHSIDHGTQIPYIKKAIELGYDVLVTNTNNNHRFVDDDRFILNGNENPEAHIMSVWEQLIEPVFDTIDAIAIVAHSFGGIVTLTLANEYAEQLLSKCFAVALTDSVHHTGHQTAELQDWILNVIINHILKSEKKITSNNFVLQFSVWPKLCDIK